MAEKGNLKRPVAINTSRELLVRSLGAGWEFRKSAMGRQNGIRDIPGGFGISLLKWPANPVDDIVTDSCSKDS